MNYRWGLSKNVHEKIMTRPWKSLCVVITATLLVGCAAANIHTPPASAPIDNSPTGKDGHNTDNGDEAAAEQLAAVHYYIGKLPDRTYVDTYGGEEHPRTWYTAAEALGAMGKIAIPALIERLDTSDPYELKLALYALMLASQDPVLLAETHGDYLRLTTVLTQETNDENLRRARAWVQRHRHLLP